MILTKDMPDAHIYTIHDCTGKAIPYVQYFDSDTCEIEMGIPIATEKGSSLVMYLRKEPSNQKEDETHPIFLRFKLPGAYIAEHTQEELEQKKTEQREKLKQLLAETED